jgi:hypothetical protein
MAAGNCQERCRHPLFASLAKIGGPVLPFMFAVSVIALGHAKRASPLSKLLNNFNASEVHGGAGL